MQGSKRALSTWTSIGLTSLALLSLPFLAGCSAASDSEAEAEASDDPASMQCTTCDTTGGEDPWDLPEPDEGDGGAGGGSGSCSEEPPCIDLSAVEAASTTAQRLDELNDAVQAYAEAALERMNITYGSVYTVAGGAQKTCSDDTRYNCRDYAVTLNAAAAFNAQQDGELQQTTELMSLQVASDSTSCVTDTCTGEQKAKSSSETCTKDVPMAISLHAVSTSGLFFQDADTSASKLYLRLPFYDSKDAATASTSSGVYDSDREWLISRCDDDSSDSFWDIDWLGPDKSDGASQTPTVQYPEIMGYTDWGNKWAGDGCFWADLRGSYKVNNVSYWTFSLQSSADVKNTIQYVGDSVPVCNTTAELDANPITVPSFVVDYVDSSCNAKNIGNFSTSCGYDNDFDDPISASNEQKFCSDLTTSMKGNLASTIRRKLDQKSGCESKSAIETMRDGLPGMLSGILTAHGVTKVMPPHKTLTLVWKKVSVSKTSGFTFELTQRTKK